MSNLNVTAGAPATPNKVDVKLSSDGKIRVFNFRGTVIGSVITGGETSEKAACTVFRSTEIPATTISDLAPGAAVWETANSATDDGSLSATNRFDISTGQTITYSLACEELFGISFL